jgi:Tfp pilus assembly protein PilF
MFRSQKNKMKKILLALFTLTIISTAQAQLQEASMKETARNYMRSGDWDNAILVLNRAIQQDPTNLDYQKDLAMTFYYKKDYVRGMELVKDLLERDDADVIVYQIGGNIYKALEEVKEAEKMYKKGLKKFPKSGPLFSEYGELLWAKKDYSAITQWEKGIEMDPSFAGNYYNAAVYYFYTQDKLWTIIYGEIFVNMEYLTERATEMKKLVLKAYKEKLFTNVDGGKEDKKKSNFNKAVLNTYNRQASVVDRGMNLETLHMLRTRFVLDWFNNNNTAKQFPYRLFEYQQQLIREGMFEAYNQWLFGSVENLSAYDQWTRSNIEASEKFSNFQKGRVFKIPAGQFYH